MVRMAESAVFREAPACSIPIPSAKYLLSLIFHASAMLTSPIKKSKSPCLVAGRWVETRMHNPSDSLNIH